MVVVASVGLSVGACGSDSDQPATATTLASTTTVSPVVTTVAPTTATPTPTTKAPSKAATAVIEPDSVAGLALGASKADSIAVLGTPGQMGQETDLSGEVRLPPLAARWQPGPHLELPDSVGLVPPPHRLDRHWRRPVHEQGGEGR